MGMSRSLGSMVVRIVADGLGAYKAEMNAVATSTADAADKIDKSSKLAGAAAAQMGGDVAQAADAAQALQAGAGAAGVGVAAFAVILGAASYAAYKGAQEQLAYQKALILSGNAAGTTAGQMADMARAIGQNVGTQYQAAEALTALAGTGQVAGGSLQKLGEVAVQMQRTMGVSVQDTAKQFAELGQEPVKASLKLNESMHYLTASTFEQIKAAQDMGDADKAASLAQDAYALALKERTAEIGKNMGLIERGWLAVKGAAKWAWDTMLDIGRPTTLNAQLVAAAKAVEHYETALRVSNGGMGTPAIKEKLAAAKEVAAGLRAQVDAEVAAAEAVGQRTRAETAGVQAIEMVSAANAKALTKQEQMTQALGAYRKGLEDIRAVNPASALLDTAQIAKTEASIANRYKETAKAVKAVVTEQEKAAKLIDDLVAKGTGFNANFAEQWIVLSKAAEGTAGLEQARAALLAQQPKYLEAAKAEADAIKAADKAQQDAMATQDKATQSAQAALAKQLEHNATIGLSTMALAELEAEKLSDQAISKDSLALVADQIDWSGKLGNKYRDEAKALRELASAKVAGAQKQTTYDAAQEQIKAQKSAAEASSKYWEDALMRAFESGKGFFQSLWDTIKNTLKTQVLKVTIQGVIGSVTSGSAIASDASDASGLSSLVNSGLGSIIGQGATLASMGTAFGEGFMATLGGSTLSGGSAAGILATGGAAGAGTAGAIGAAAPYVLAAIAAYEILSGPNFTSTSGTGDASRQFDAKGNAIGMTAYEPYGGMSATADQTITALQSAYAAQVAALGITAVNTSFGYGGNTGREGASPNFLLTSSAGGVNYVGAETPVTKEAMALEASRAVFAALQGSELPKYLQGAFDGLSAASMTQEQITTSLNNAAALKQFNDILKLMPAHFEQLATLSYKATQGLIAASGGLDKLQTNLGTYYTNFYSAEEQRAQTIKNINAATSGSGLDAATATRDQFKAIVEAQDLTTESGQKMYAALLGVSGAFAGITPAIVSAADAAKALKDAAKSAYDALTKAIDAEKARVQITIDLAQEQVTAITAVFNTLKTNVDALYASVSSTASTSAAQGNAFITQALATAQSTGYLPDNTQLADAIAASRGGIDAAVYASQQDADFARLELAGRLDQLKTISGDQLTGADKALKVAQDQLTALDLMATNAKAQLDALDGISGMVLSIGEAMGAFDKAIAAAGGAVAPTDAVATSFGGGGGAGIVGSQSAYSQKTWTPAGINDTYITDATAISRLDTLKGIINTVGVATSQDVASLASFAQSWGYTMQDVANATGYLVDDWAKVFSNAGVTAFTPGAGSPSPLLPGDGWIPSPTDGAKITMPYPSIDSKIPVNPDLFYASGVPLNSGALGSTEKLEALIVDLTANVAALGASSTRTANAVEGNQNRPILVEIA